MKYLTNLLVAAFTVVSPLKVTIIAVFVLVLFDALTGIIAAKRSGIPIVSNGFRRTLVKLLVYCLVIVLGFLVETFLTGDMMPLTKIIQGMVGLTELKSSLENIESITGIPVLKTLINKITGVENQ